MTEGSQETEWRTMLNVPQTRDSNEKGGGRGDME
jgi:hypothetical protein